MKEDINTWCNPTIWNRLKRYELCCSTCPPNRSENKKHHKKYGVRPSKNKQINRDKIK